jgi:hypothetical protein
MTCTVNLVLAIKEGRTSPSRVPAFLAFAVGADNADAGFVTVQDSLILIRKNLSNKLINVYNIGN